MTRKAPTSALGDALVINYEAHEVSAVTWAAFARCECRRITYTAVSGSAEACRSLIYRKHRRHLPHCPKQAALLAEFPRDRV